MSGSKATMASVFDRLQSRDKDFRYMATSDLIEMLKDPITWKQDGETERRLCDQILSQLDDSSSDVSSLAVKCLGYLVQRVQPDKADKILDTLCTRLVAGKKEADRESASISLKSTILDLPGETAKGILKHVVPKLLQGTQTKEPPDVAAASLDIMNDVVLKFGHMLGNEQTQLRNILLQGLVDPKPVIRKRAVNCLASLVPYLSDAALEQIATHIMTGLRDSKGNDESMRVWSQALGAVGRSVGWRFSPFVGNAIPLVVDSWRSAPEMDEELRELCLAALEGFVLRCPQASRGHLDVILDVVQASLSYDPNYADDMEEDKDADEEDDEDEMSDEQFSDDDDASWKVRRGAAKVLAAVYTNYSGDLDALYPKTVPSLLTRFREREENVRADIFVAFITLLQQASARASRDRAPGVVEMLAGDAPDILKASLKQLRNKSLKTRTGILHLLKDLLATLPDGQIRDTDQLLPGVIAAIHDQSSSSSQLRIQALQFLGVALTNSSPAVWQKYMSAMAGPVVAAAGDRYSVVSAEGLRVCESLVAIMRPDPSRPMPSQHEAAAGAVLQAVKSRLTAQDQDQEVKECAVSCAAALIAQLGDCLQQEYGNLMQGLLDRLQSDTTRLAAVKAFGRIAESPLPLDMAPVLDRLLTDLTSYLRKTNRPLRQAALAAIEAVTARQGAAVSSERMAAAVDEVANLVNDSDLLVTPLALRFCLKLLPQQPQNANHISSRFLPAALQLVTSPLLQGAALDEVLAFFPAVLASGSSAVTFDSMLSSLLAAGNAPDTSKTAQHNIACCIASLTAHTSQQQINAVVKGLLTQLQTGNGSWAVQGEQRGRKRAASQETMPGADNVRRLALLNIGRIGRQASLKDFPQMQQTLISALAGNSEDIKAAASLALGGVAIGDLNTHLPFIIRQIQEQAMNPKDQYLLLKSLNEVIVSISSGATGKQLSPAHQQEVLALLLASCEGEEECRNVVAECMGHLALLNPTQVVPEVLKLRGAASAGQRSVAVTAVKVATVPQTHAIDDVLRPVMLPLLQLISDPDRGVRKAAVQMLSSAAHSKASLVDAQLLAVLPQLFQQTVIDPSLIRTVDLGPFKHKIDDGLELRKATFECMDVLLDACPGRLDYHAFLAHLESGLKDHYDVKLPCHLLLAKLAVAAPGQLLANLHRLTEPLEKTLQTKVKSDAVKQEVDRNEDMIRSALRAVDAISRVSNVDACVPFKQLMQNVVLQDPMASKFRTVRDERAEAEGAFSK